MARTLTLEVLGLPDLTTSLDALRDDLRAELSGVMQRTATKIRDTAAGRAPHRTGDLARAIQAQGSGLSWRVGLVDETISSRGGRNTAHLNPSVYGVWYEFGFKTRNIASHPFMGISADEAEAGYDAAVDAVLAKVTT